MTDCPVILAPLQPLANVRCTLQELVLRPGFQLQVIVLAESDRGIGRRFAYRFERCAGMVVLDEGDLITIWESPHHVPAASILYEVVQGSILESLSQRRGVLSVAMPEERLDRLHEYLVVTDFECILVLSARPPQVEETGTEP